MKSVKNIGRLFKDTVNSWIGDKVPQLASALAYCTIKAFCARGALDGGGEGRAG